MKQHFMLMTTVGAVSCLTAACNATPNRVQQVDAVGQSAASISGKTVNHDELPINQRFRTLDDYLAWLKQYAAPTDRPWYEEISPGVYKLRTGNFRPMEGAPGAEKRTFTRNELERQFGFKR